MRNEGERLLEQGSPVRSYDTASLPQNRRNLLFLYHRIDEMTKEKKTFAWDTIMTLSLTSNKMTVKGTDIEVNWCPITKMFWEI